MKLRATYRSLLHIKYSSTVAVCRETTSAGGLEARIDGTDDNRHKGQCQPAESMARLRVNSGVGGCGRGEGESTYKQIERG